jgi:hypothetical protein
MSETKRKTHTSTAVKARYNAKTYDKISCAVPKATAAAFKEKCAREGISQASIIKQAINDYLAK